jgi:hypothetical protein
MVCCHARIFHPSSSIVFRSGLKVGVLSGPGHCPRSRYRRRSGLSSADRKSENQQLVMGVLQLDSRVHSKVMLESVCVVCWL